MKVILFDLYESLIHNVADFKRKVVGLVLTEVTMNCRPAPVLKPCQSPLPGHCCNSGTSHGASPGCFPHTTERQLTQPVAGYTVRDTVLELGLLSGTRTVVGS